MWSDPQETANSFTFTQEIRNGKLYFLCNWGGGENAETLIKLITEIFQTW